MTRSRSFSIYLLKPGYTAENSLRENHPLINDARAKGLPDNAVLYVLDSKPYPPWWRDYFRIEKDLTQVSKGALVFLPVDNRCFALSFGHVAHNLLDFSYEYDFGLRITLNSLDPKKLKSTDTLDPGVAKRRRTQLPTESELTVFDFDRDSTVLRSLTGKVREEHKDLFKHATGGSNLRISSDVAADGLHELGNKLLTLYESNQYKVAFPEIQNIVPVRDPVQIETLNELLLKAFQRRDPDLNITVPDIINYSDNLYVKFSGAGESLIYDDVYIGCYFEYLDKHEIDLASIDIDALRRHALVLTDEHGNSRDRYSILKSLIFEATIEGTASETFHLSEGSWYKIDNDYIARLSAFLDPLCVESDLPPYNHASEGTYNDSVAQTDRTVACLDRKNISPDGSSQVEPCDLLAVRDGTATFYHIKVSTLSAQLSHLFNQGVNSVELLRLEAKAVDKLEILIRENLTKDCADSLRDLIKAQKYRLVFGIVTRKEPSGKSRNLPLFSRISLMRAMKAMQLMNVPASLIFIPDQSDKSEGRKKKRKKSGPAAKSE